MAVRTITVALDEQILQEARVLAAQQGVTLSAFLRNELSRLVEEQRGFGKARDAALRRLQRGHALGGETLPARDELHDRARGR